MPNTKIKLIKTNLRRYTFENKKIKKWTEDQCNKNGITLNLFAGKTKLNIKEIRNDIDIIVNAKYQYDALDFIKFWKNKHNNKKFSTVILDPPYSFRKAIEMYKGNYSSRFKRIADVLPDIITKNANIISFGYHSSFLGKKRGYKLLKMCVFAHGGAQHCTIAIVEKHL